MQATRPAVKNHTAMRPRLIYFIHVWLPACIVTISGDCTQATLLHFIIIVAAKADGAIS
jgi:hypothetical protein